MKRASRQLVKTKPVRPPARQFARKTLCPDNSFRQAVGRGRTDDKDGLEINRVMA